MRKPSRKSLVRKLDAIFSEFIRKRDILKNPICPLCKTRPISCCFHWVTRAHHKTRWDADNAIGACDGCNYRYEFDPHPMIEQFIRERGLATYERLVQKSRGIAKFSNSDLEQMASDFRQKLEAL